jgi:Plasmid encoded RepA protein
VGSFDVSAPRNSIEQGAQPPDDLAYRLRLLGEMALPPELQVRQLLQAGFSPQQIQPHFPQVSESVFVAPRPIVSPRRTSRMALSHAATLTDEEAAATAVPSVVAVLQRITARIVAQPTANPSRPAAIPRAFAATQESTASQEAVSEGISFQYVPLIQCSFPHADPGALTHFTRRNGWLELTLSTARPDTGLPYGVPARLLTMYCASEAVRTRSPEIFLGSSVHDFLRRLDVPITRGERGSLRAYANQLLRLVHCAVSIDENIRDASGRTGLHIRQALFVEEARLWWDEADAVGQGSSLILSSVLFDSILERSAPLSTAAIRQLRKSPMDLDVYAWLAHRLFQLTRPSTISWAQLSGQFGHDYHELRYFRRFFGDSLKRVLKVYPEAKLKWSNTGITLLPSKPHIEHRSTIKA